MLQECIQHRHWCYNIASSCGEGGFEMKKVFSVTAVVALVIVLLSNCSAARTPGMQSGTDSQNQQQQTATNNIQETPSQKAKKQAADTSRFIGQEKAKSIALQKAGITAEGVVFDRVELDNDNGVWQYEVEFRKGRTEYDADVKATDGTILKWEVELDD